MWTDAQLVARATHELQTKGWIRDDFYIREEGLCLIGALVMAEKGESTHPNYLACADIDAQAILRHRPRLAQALACAVEASDEHGIVDVIDLIMAYNDEVCGSQSEAILFLAQTYVELALEPYQTDDNEDFNETTVVLPAHSGAKVETLV